MDARLHTHTTNCQKWGLSQAHHKSWQKQYGGVDDLQRTINFIVAAPTTPFFLFEIPSFFTWTSEMCHNTRMRQTCTMCFLFQSVTVFFQTGVSLSESMVLVQVLVCLFLCCIQLTDQAFCPLSYLHTSKANLHYIWPAEQCQLDVLLLSK